MALDRPQHQRDEQALGVAAREVADELVGEQQRDRGDHARPQPGQPRAEPERHREREHAAGAGDDQPQRRRPVVAEQRERRREQHRQRLPRRALERDEVDVQDLAAPDDPRPRVVGRRRHRQQRQGADRQAAEDSSVMAPAAPGRAHARRCARRTRPRGDGLALTAARAPRGSRPAPRRRGRRARRGAPVSEPAVERGERHAARVGELARAALEQQPVAGHEDPLRGLGGRVLPAAELQLVGASSYRPAAPSAVSRSKRAARAKPGSASRSNTRAKRRAGVHSSSPRNAASCEPARSAQARYAATVRARSPGRSGTSPAAHDGRASRIAACSSARAGEREQEREPRRLLEVGLGGHLRVRPGRLEPRGRRRPARRRAARRRRSRAGRGRARCGSRRRRRGRACA